MCYRPTPGAARSCSLGPSQHDDSTTSREPDGPDGPLNVEWAAMNEQPRRREDE
jgi:hypothetical protein